MCVLIGIYATIHDVFSPDVCKEDDCLASSRSRRPFCFLLSLARFAHLWFSLICTLSLCFPAVPSNQKKTDVLFMTKRESAIWRIRLYIYIYKYILIYMLYDGWNYGRWPWKIQQRKRAPCFPRGHFARWCMHGLTKRPSWQRQKMQYSVSITYILPTREAEEICFFILYIPISLYVLSSVIIYCLAL